MQLLSYLSWLISLLKTVKNNKKYSILYFSLKKKTNIDAAWSYFCYEMQ